jgi:hypothetical protein
VVVRTGFTQVVGNAFAGLGFPAEAPIVHEFPMEMFLPDSDLTPIKEQVAKIVDALTTWQPKIETKGVFHPPMVSIQGKDYQEAVTAMNNLFLKYLWGDELPLLPATNDQVGWMLTGTDLPRDTVIGKITPRGGIATVQDLAVSLVMAGGRPEYLPVLIAAVEAISQPEWGLERMNATTSSIYPAVIVNGPVAKQIRLNAGYGCLGPDPLHPSGGPIGRALRLILQNMGGALPGSGTMAIYGAMRYTNAVFAEDEAGFPPGWRPLSVERGFAPGKNVVTVIPVGSATNVMLTNADATSAEGTQLEYLYRMAGFMRTPNMNLFADALSKDPNFPAGVVLIASGWARDLAQAGYSEDNVKRFLWENSKIPWSDLVKAGLVGKARTNHWISAEGQAVPLVPTPEQLTVVVAGGSQAGHAYWMQVGSTQYRVLSREVKLPTKWDALLKQAEAQIGPVPAR